VAHPKRKTSKSKRDKRRTHWVEKSINPVECSRCHEYKLPHHVCPSCGYYDGEKIVPEKKASETKTT
jgi:large subunit ribosomal protein L32